MKKNTLFWILVISFIFRIFLYINTTSFHISEAGSVLGGFERINNGEIVYVFEQSYNLALSYVIYFFYAVSGSIHLFFVFQCFLSTLTLYFVYLIVFRISTNQKVSLFSLIIASLYFDFALLPSIAYNQAFEVFFTVLSVLILLKSVEDIPISKYLLNATCLLFVIYASLLFRGTMKYFYFILPVISLYIFFSKRLMRHVAVRLFITSCAFFLILTTFSPYSFLAQPNRTGSNNFTFFGHTDYGGLGGEGSFIYEKNKLRYEKNLNNFLEKKGIKDPTKRDIRDFQNEEKWKYITTKPHLWFLLQIRKILYTYGAVPVRDSLHLLMTGRIRLGLILSLLLIQMTFMLPIVMLVIFFDWRKFHLLLTSSRGFTFFIVFIYLLTATSLYGHYSERYRIVVMVCSIIPFIALFFDLAYYKKIISDRNLLYKKLIIVLIIASIWLYQVYEALITNAERYFAGIQKML